MQLVLKEALKKQTNMLDVLLLGLRIYKNCPCRQTATGWAYPTAHRSLEPETAGALLKPKGITRYSKCPRGVLKALFHSSPLPDPDKMVG